MPRAVIWWGFRSTSLRPSKRTRPRVGWYTPVTTLKTVVLPAPLGPMSAKIDPSGTDRLTSLRATTPPNAIVSESSSRRPSGIVDLERAFPDDLGAEWGRAAAARLGHVLHLGLAAPCGYEALRTEDHHRDQRGAEPQVAGVLEAAEAFREVADDHRPDDHAGQVSGSAENHCRQEQDRALEHKVVGRDRDHLRREDHARDPADA